MNTASCGRTVLNSPVSLQGLRRRLFGVYRFSREPPNNRLLRRASHLFGAEMQNGDRISSAIWELRLFQYRFQTRNNYPLFLFLCGGDDSDPRYVCRREVERYIKINSRFKRVLTVKPEILLNEYAPAIEGINLLELEAIIADLSDAILLFDESAGSLCELGAFAMSPPIRKILTACIPEEYSGRQTFVIQGPVRLIETNSTALSSVIYLDIECPFSSPGLNDYLEEFESNARQFHHRRINRNSDEVDFGSFTRECLDLITVFAPLKDYELLEIYKSFKGFEAFNFKIGTLESLPRSLSYKVALAYLASTRLVTYDMTTGMLDMVGEVPGYFMFSPSRRTRIQTIRADILGYKRKAHREIGHVYR